MDGVGVLMPLGTHLAAPGGAWWAIVSWFVPGRRGPRLALSRVYNFWPVGTNIGAAPLVRRRRWKA